MVSFGFVQQHLKGIGIDFHYSQKSTPEAARTSKDPELTHLPDGMLARGSGVPG